MKHMISINPHFGRTVPEMRRMHLDDALDYTIKNAPANKFDCWLMASGYSSKTEVYHRGEDCFDCIDTILLDFDNEDEDGNVYDKDLLTNFEKEFAQYDHIVWESASSKEDHPKFRAIFLLDKTIPYLQSDGVKYTKRAILSIFSKYRPDRGASWYFTPTLSKVCTVKRTNGIPFPSLRVEWLANSMMKTDMMNTAKFSVNQKNEGECNSELRNRDWHNLRNVQNNAVLIQGQKRNQLISMLGSLHKAGYDKSDAYALLDEFRPQMNEPAKNMADLKKVVNEFWR